MWTKTNPVPLQQHSHLGRIDPLIKLHLDKQLHNFYGNVLFVWIIVKCSQCYITQFVMWTRSLVCNSVSTYLGLKSWKSPLRFMIKNNLQPSLRHHDLQYTRRGFKFFLWTANQQVCFWTSASVSVLLLFRYNSIMGKPDKLKARSYYLTRLTRKNRLSYLFVLNWLMLTKFWPAIVLVCWSMTEIVLWKFTQPSDSQNIMFVW